MGLKVHDKVVPKTWVARVQLSRCESFEISDNCSLTDGERMGIRVRYLNGCSCWSTLIQCWGSDAVCLSGESVSNFSDSERGFFSFVLSSCCKRATVTAPMCQTLWSNVTNTLHGVCIFWSDILLGVFSLKLAFSVLLSICSVSTHIYSFIDWEANWN